MRRDVFMRKELVRAGWSDEDFDHIRQDQDCKVRVAGDVPKAMCRQLCV